MKTKVYLKKKTTKELRKHLFLRLREIRIEENEKLKKGLIFMFKDFLKSIHLANNLNDNFTKRFNKLISFFELVINQEIKGKDRR